MGVEIDGIIGFQTIRTVRAWQKANGLVADGRVGPKTLEKMGFAEQGVSTDLEKHRR